MEAEKRKAESLLRFRIIRIVQSIAEEFSFKKWGTMSDIRDDIWTFRGGLERTPLSAKKGEEHFPINSIIRKVCKKRTQGRSISSRAKSFLPRSTAEFYFSLFSRPRNRDLHPSLILAAAAETLNKEFLKREFIFLVFLKIDQKRRKPFL